MIHMLFVIGIEIEIVMIVMHLYIILHIEMGYTDIFDWLKSAYLKYMLSNSIKFCKSISDLFHECTDHTLNSFRI